ncbi:MAG: hypothetical protein VXY73_07385 [Pseudomonadota bacterium]|nr:hypothetical protein [Pseudomonadota bacterium]
MTKGGFFPLIGGMDELIEKVTAFADAVNRTPNAIIRAAVGAKYSAWDDWVNGKSSPTMRTADRIYAYMDENDPSQIADEVSAA